MHTVAANMEPFFKAEVLQLSLLLTHLSYPSLLQVLKGRSSKQATDALSSLVLIATALREALHSLHQYSQGCGDEGIGVNMCGWRLRRGVGERDLGVSCF